MGVIFLFIVRLRRAAIISVVPGDFSAVLERAQLSLCLGRNGCCRRRAFETGALSRICAPNCIYRPAHCHSHQPLFSTHFGRPLLVSKPTSYFFFAIAFFGHG